MKQKHQFMKKTAINFFINCIFLSYDFCYDLFDIERSVFSYVLCVCGGFFKNLPDRKLPLSSYRRTVQQIIKLYIHITVFGYSNYNFLL